MPRPTEPVAVRHPETGQFITLDPGTDYESDDLLVKSFPWAFAPKAAPRVVDSVSVEVATAEPGQRRTRTKPAK
jgi:hypothetical protein